MSKCHGNPTHDKQTWQYPLASLHERSIAQLRVALFPFGDVKYMNRQELIDLWIKVGEASRYDCPQESASAH